MRSPTDVVLSLQRHAGRALPEPWAVLTELEDETPERPYAIVALDGEPETAGLLTSPTMDAAATIYAYPEAGAKRTEAARAAEGWSDALWRLFSLGEGRDGPGRPMLLPLYDFTGRDEVQRVTLPAATSGTFALEHDGVTTAAIPRRAQARDLRLALEPLPSIGAGNVIVSAARTGGPWAVRFTGALAGVNVPTLDVDMTGLSGPDVDADVPALVEVLAAGSPDPWRSPVDFVRVDRLQVGERGDVGDPRQRIVTARMRLTWHRAGNVASPEMILRDVTARKA